jgi:hypothetical protein
VTPRRSPLHAAVATDARTLKSPYASFRLLSELAVIVVGILLALAADSWWEERQERALELEYLEAFREDVRQRWDDADLRPGGHAGDGPPAAAHRVR